MSYETDRLVQRCGARALSLLWERDEDDWFEDIKDELVAAYGEDIYDLAVEKFKTGIAVTLEKPVKLVNPVKIQGDEEEYRKGVAWLDSL